MYAFTYFLFSFVIVSEFIEFLINLSNSLLDESGIYNSRCLSYLLGSKVLSLFILKSSKYAVLPPAKTKIVIVSVSSVA